MSMLNISGFTKSWLLVVVLACTAQFVHGQNASSNFRINIQNVRLNAKLDTISYDVYLQDVNPDIAIAVPGFGVQLTVPQADLGMSVKTVAVSNASRELGAKLPTMVATNDGNWLMKFQNAIPPLAYENALLLSETFPGTRIATFSISNADGQLFSNPQKFTLAYAGATPSKKSSVSVFQPGSITLFPRTATYEVEKTFSGLGSYSLLPASGDFELFPNPTIDGFYINASVKGGDLSVFDMGGRKMFTQKVMGRSYVDVSNLASGAYVVDLHGVRTKLVKK